MPFDVTTSSVSVHSTLTSGIAYSSPGPVTAIKSGKTEVGHSPSAGNALFAGTFGAGASVAATAVVVVSTTEESDAAAVLEAADSSPPHALNIAIDNEMNKAIREIFTSSFS